MQYPTAADRRVQQSAMASGGNDIGNIDRSPEKMLRILYGGLVGGPAKDDSFQDKRSNYKQSEVSRGPDSMLCDNVLHGMLVRSRLQCSADCDHGFGVRAGQDTILSQVMRMQVDDLIVALVETMGAGVFMHVDKLAAGADTRDYLICTRLSPIFPA